MTTYFVSGHLDITPEEFVSVYVPKLEDVLKEKDVSFVVGDANGVDNLTHVYLMGKTENVTVYHMFERPRCNCWFPTKGGFKTDEERDAAMTRDSDEDIAWLKPKRENSGTAKNLKRRFK